MTCEHIKSKSLGSIVGKWRLVAAAVLVLAGCSQSVPDGNPDNASPLARSDAQPAGDTSATSPNAAPGGTGDTAAASPNAEPGGTGEAPAESPQAATGQAGAEQTRVANKPNLDDVEERPAGRDIFAACRVAPISNDGLRYWSQLADAVRHLKTLEGAHVVADTGQLLLYGEYSEELGPLRLGDLVLALWNEFHGKEALGMTIDPDPKDKYGPLMDVKFFGGSRNTNFGYVMFECDRLMKCISLGKDNVTKKPVTSKVKDFYTYPTLALHLGSGSGGSWARFWIVNRLAEFAEDDSRGKPVVFLTDDKHTIWIKHAPLYVQTEEMHDPGGGQDLVGKGKEGKVAKRFADHFSHYYDQFGEEFPVFAELKEISKFLLVAQWIHEWQVPIDYELMYLQIGGDVKTPTQTPSLQVQETVREGNTVHGVKVFGGVELESKTFFGQDSQGEAKSLAGTLTPHVQKAQNRTSIVIEQQGQSPRQVAVAGHPIRGPPATQRTRTRAAIRLTESQGELKPTSEPGAFFRADRSQTPAQGDYDLPVFVDPVTQQEHLNMPVLRVGFSPRAVRSVSMTLGPQKFDVRVPDYLYLTSPLRDVNVQFDLATPDVDISKNRAYFPSKTPGVKGYYPKSNSVVFNDGTTIRFNPETGAVAEISGGGKPPLEFSHVVYEDHSLVRQSPENPNHRARPPPGPRAAGPSILRESTGDIRPSSPSAPTIRTDPKALEPTVMEIRNTATGKSLRVRHRNGKLVYIEVE